jgi:biotin transport system substrate-specific component
MTPELQLEKTRWYAPVAPALPARRVLAVLAGTLFITVCSRIAVPLPWTPVPMTMQPFAVLLLGLVLGRTLGAATVVLYLLEGALGLPVFTAQGGVGLHHLFGPSGGYLMSYPAAAIVAGSLFRAGRQRSFARALGSAGAAAVLILTCGFCWLLAITHSRPGAAWAMAVYPFLAGDLLKVLLASSLAAGWERSRERTSRDLV